MAGEILSHSFVGSEDAPYLNVSTNISHGKETQCIDSLCDFLMLPSLERVHIPPLEKENHRLKSAGWDGIWVFPKIRGTPKWMVYNGKPY